MDHDHQAHEGCYSNPVFKWIFIGFLLVAGYFLIMEHKAHLAGVLGVLPFLLLLACPLMHLFMHHGHRHDGANPSQKDDRGEQK